MMDQPVTEEVNVFISEKLQKSFPYPLNLRNHMNVVVTVCRLLYAVPMQLKMVLKHIWRME